MFTFSYLTFIEATLCTTVADQPIIITRDKSQTLQAFYNVCTHRGAQLVEKDGTYPVSIKVDWNSKRHVRKKT